MGEATEAKVYEGEMQSMRKKVANFEKHLRIAQAASDPAEVMKHLSAAERLAIRYGFPRREDSREQVLSSFGAQE